MHRRRAWLAVVAGVVALMTPGVAVAGPGGTLVSTGSPTSPFSQNKQNEPSVAIDPINPNVVVAGSNDNIDMEACNAGDPTTCPFTDGVGVSGVYFSFDSGKTWTQPTYTGWTARNCLGPDACQPEVGPIGTLPWYYESGLVSDGDPALAFGPRPGPGGTFSWDNGSRLYYANLTANFSAQRSETAFKGYEAIAVSRTDDPAAAAGSTGPGNKTTPADQSAWMPPVLASQQTATTFSDKEQIHVDNAASSPHFGTVYVCWASFLSNSFGRAYPTPLIVARSTDGGDTWTQTQVGPATDNSINSQPDGCTIRTDSTGNVYVFGLATRNGASYASMYKSTDAGASWSQLSLVTRVYPPGVDDPVLGRPVMDGVAGARADLAAAPSVDIANGAPSGTDATDQIVLTWADARAGLNHEKVMMISSTDGGATWSEPRVISEPGDRGYYTAPAIAPDGKNVYVVYNAFTTPYRENTTDTRDLVGVMLHASVAPDGTIGPFQEAVRADAGDPRASSQNNLVAEFLGDYVYAAATRGYGTGVWNASGGAVCSAIDTWRMSLENGTSASRPAPQQDCRATFGDTDIDGATVSATP